MEAVSNRAQTSSAELNARVTAFFNTPSDTVSERDRHAQRAALTFSSERIILEGEVESLRAHLAHLELLIANHAAITAETQDQQDQQDQNGSATRTPMAPD